MNSLLRHSMLLSAISLLAACNLNDSNLHRASLGFNIEGVHYSSKSYSGDTDAKGSFLYLPGEEVTFSIGATVLATRTPHAGMTFPDLFAVSLPRTQMTVTDVLTSYAPNGFHQMANAMALLMLLDNDQDANNGINVTAWQEPGKLPALQLNQNLYTFFYKTLAGLVKQKNLVRRRVIVSEPLMLIYKKSGIKVPAGVITESTYGYGYAYEYDDFWRIKKSVEKYGSKSFLERTIDSNGRMKELRFADNWDFASLLFQITYDNKAQIIKRYLTLSAVVNKDDPLWQFQDELLDRFYGPFQIGITSYAYRDNGWISSYDRNMDGIPESLTHSHQSYDSDGNLTLIRTETDQDADGITDAVVEDVRTYDKSGSLRSRTTPEKAEIYSYEFYENGAINQYSTLTQYDEQDWSEYISDYNRDGYLLRSEFRKGAGYTQKWSFVYQYEYDESGRMILYSYDGYGDRNYAFIHRYIYTGTSSELPADYEVQTYDGSNLTLTSVVTHHSRFDTDGNLISETITDSDADGVPDSVERVTREITADGAVVNEVHLRDYEGDGVFTGYGVDEYKRQPYADALAYLIEFNTPRSILMRLPGDNEPNDFWMAQLPILFGSHIDMVSLPDNNQ